MTVILLFLIMTSSVTLVTGYIVQGENYDHPKFLFSNIERHEPMVLAANESNSPAGEENSKTESTRKGSESDGGSKTGNTDPSTKVKPAPRKSFVPSEKIPAEQAVDFPVDI